ncbi:MAG: hypothetical protein COV76_04970 [Candidatus Omnitrophica bacterium CG11_big_fil_rev_8_21_14_0_20_64_10]|nr:MAG: hypothetical protein COV76_04970 [Candidatus Omnitrophica bacterium CG11_big_fil_rev_8_21_14_0_20_64_10]
MPKKPPVDPGRWALAVALLALGGVVLLLFQVRELRTAVRSTRPAVSHRMEPKTEPAKPRPSATVPLPVKRPAVSGGRIALVLDDWGYNKRNFSFLKSVKVPLTVAVLPSVPYSGSVSRAAAAAGHEVILHLPMESERQGIHVEAGTLTTDMSDAEILDHLDSALRTVSDAKGVSNHQGSEATSDQRLMRTLLTELKRRRLYFLDSLVIPTSVGRETAAAVGIPFARRAVFLDNDSDPEVIRARFMELIHRVDREGAAVGIGHDRVSTVQVLETIIPELQAAGYRFVPVSELTEVPREERDS